jgi:hypothetical protein
VKLSDVVVANRRFSRSANVERDHGSEAIDGYIPTGRAVDVIHRLARGLADASAGRAFSITGPHGGGKSSLAVFLDAALAPRRRSEHRAAMGLLSDVDPQVSEALLVGLKALDPQGRGFVRAFVTAEREPVGHTVARALYKGAVADLGTAQREVPKSFATPERTNPTPRDILRALRAVTAQRPVVLVVDEFGKNLEAYAEIGGDGDPFLLQELAEAAQGLHALPFAIITMQHLSFDEYVQEASTTRRREWAKVQGRFQDIPYVETAAQSRRLIAASITRAPGALDAAVKQWNERALPVLAGVGLRELEDSAADAYPLHPLALAVLPELCSRYGQNERTLFSFLAGSEPLSVASFLESAEWKRGADLPFVGLDRIYDYFLDSASTTIGTSATASRWLEIESRIRDTAGLAPNESRVLKWIGVLNLISSAGTLRASRELLEFGLGSSGASSLSADEVSEVLGRLEALGLVTYREFADEYRIWNGSDYDLRGSVELARRDVVVRSLPDLLNGAVPLDAVVAGRHSQAVGVLRVLERRFSDMSGDDIAAPDAASQWDGRILYMVSEGDTPLPKKLGLRAKPILVVRAEVPSDLRELAVEAVALREALRSAEASDADWVARRELIERASVAQQRVADRVAEAWRADRTEWILLNDLKPVSGIGGASSAASTACDRVYSQAPRVANEMIARRELTSQGAKARRMLLEAFLEHGEIEAFGIEGYGPDRAMYEALFRQTGLHTEAAAGEWVISAPKTGHWKLAWAALNEALSASIEARVNLVDVADVLKAPPFGPKDGVIPVLLVAALTARGDEIALYEHGSLVLVLDDAVAERLCRNLGHFTVKNPAATSGPRRAVVDAVVEALEIRSVSGRISFLQATRAIYRVLRTLEPYAQNTKSGVSANAVAVRTAFRLAAEPDELLFTTLPEVLGHEPFPATGRVDRQAAVRFADDLASAMRDLRTAYSRLLDSVLEQLEQATATFGSLDSVQAQLSGQAANLQGTVLEPRLRSFVGALGRGQLEPEDWIANVAMVVAEGQSPRVWSDDHVSRFEFQVQELGGALRRMSALLFENRAGGGQAFDARRVTITRPDGSETTDIVSLTDAQRAAVDAEVGEAWDALAARLGSVDAARQTLLAWLVLTETGDATLGVSPKARRAGGDL